MARRPKLMLLPQHEGEQSKAFWTCALREIYHNPEKNTRNVINFAAAEIFFHKA